MAITLPRSSAFAVHQSSKLLINRHGMAVAAEIAARHAFKLEQERSLEAAAHWRDVEAAIMRRGRGQSPSRAERTVIDAAGVTRTPRG